MFRLPRMFRTIENRNYRLYFFGQQDSLLGSWLQSVALAWLVYRLTGSSFQLGLVVFVGQVPLLFLSPIGGLIAARYLGTVATQAISMLPAFVLAVLTLWGTSEIVDTDNLLNAVALNSSIFSDASSVAPLVAGFRVATVGEGRSADRRTPPCPGI